MSDTSPYSTVPWSGDAGVRLFVKRRPGAEPLPLYAYRPQPRGLPRPAHVEPVAEPIGLDRAALGGRPCVITGAGGFLGLRVAARLVGQGIPVRLAVRRPEKVAAFAGRPGVEICSGDLTDSAYVDRLVRGAAVVFHGAGLVSDWGAPADFETHNARASAMVADACWRQTVRRLVHVSTTDVYGYPAQPQPVLPTRDCGIPYSDSKRHAERAVFSFLERGLSATIVRPATVFGPGSVSIVQEMIDAYRKGQMMIIGSGDARVGCCYVEHLVDAMLLVAQHPGAVGEAFNVTDDAPVTWNDFIRTLGVMIQAPAPRLRVPEPLAYAAGWMLEKITPFSAHRPLLTRMAVHLLGKSHAFPIDAVRRLGYAPRFSVVESMVATAEWALRDAVI